MNFADIKLRLKIKDTANANTDKDQPKFYTYDRRLNDLYGEDLLENYKESV